MADSCVSSPGDVASGLSGYTRDEPLLLWTDYAPDNGGGGAVVLRSLIPFGDRERILWVTPSPRSSENPDAAFHLRAGSAGKGRRRSLFADSTVLAGALADETLLVAQQCRARALWVVLHGAGVPVAAELVKRRTLPLHVTVHDDPAFGVALRSRRYLALTPCIERALSRALRGADSVDVIGEEMRERYLLRYGVSSRVVHRAVAGPVAPVPEYDANRHGLRIGVLGNTYSYDPLPVLGRVLGRTARALGVPARLTMVGIGHGERLKRDLAGSGVDIESPGHVDERAATRILSECFALYLNYPFDRRAAVLRQTSFPTKLATYLNAARPILTHAPVDTTLSALSSMDGYVNRWGTMREANGEETLIRMWNERRLLKSLHEPAEVVRLRYYDPVRNRAVLNAMLNGLVGLSGDEPVTPKVVGQ